MTLEQSEGSSLDDQIDEIEKKLYTHCNLVPVASWGFDDDVKESLKQRKHRMLNQKLSKKEQSSMSSETKQQLARSIGAVPNTVQEVLEWMSSSKFAKIQPVKPKVLPKKPEKSKTDGPQPKKAKTEKNAAESDDSDSDDETENVPVKGVEKADLNGTIAEESSSDEDDADEVDAPAVVEAKVPKSQVKLEKTIKKMEEENDESPEAKRQIAMLKLQKKLFEMKTSRKSTSKGKPSAVVNEKKEAERKMKRRISKLKLKQRRAEEKKGPEVKQETEKKAEKSEKPLNESNGSSVSFNKFNFEVKQDEGKKKRLSLNEKKLKLTGRDYKSLITKVEKTQAAIDKVKEVDVERAMAMEDDLKWEKTLKRAAGGKVKDNVEMLKKALKKKEKLKDRRLAKWDDRVKKVEADKSAKQNKRKTNIAKRAEDKKKRQMTKLRKKGRLL